MKIILSAINAKYIHSAFGLRYLFANLNELKNSAKIIEFDLTDKLSIIAEKILDESPEILGLSVYIWNAVETANLLRTLKKINPELKIVLGGPEAGYLPHRVDFSQADYIIQGEGETAFYELCLNILNNKAPEEKFIKAPLPDLKKLKLPYEFYSEEDIKNRVIYAEVSRGCPFSCEFCLSSIDEKVRTFDVDKLLIEFENLWNKGVRKYKFVDRTFNLNSKISNKILDFFLEKEPPYLAHFEVIPDNFPESLKKKIAQFPPASLQLEIGIQTFNSFAAENIKRKFNLEKVKQNLTFLENETNAHLHLDLIAGLPGESLESFGEGLNKLMEMSAGEIQIGILKKLSGTTLERHDKQFGIFYSDLPPYEILKNDLIDFKTMQKIKRLARFWDIYFNSGNFRKSVKLVWKNQKVFSGFFEFSEWIYSNANSTFQISLNRQIEFLFNFLTRIRNIDERQTAESLYEDIGTVSGRKIPKFLKEYLESIPDLEEKQILNINKRQIKHL